MTLFLKIAGGVLVGLLMLGFMSILRNALESVSSRASNGFSLRRHKHMKTDWRVIQSLSVGNESD